MEEVNLRVFLNNVGDSVGDLKETNLFSYTSLRGTSILLLKAEANERYAEEKRKLMEELSIEFKPDLNYVQNLIDEWARALKANNYCVKVCEFEAISRTIVGVNEAFCKIPFEVGLSFDPVLNVPFIPSSTLKGALRHAFEELITYNYSSNKAEEVAKIIFGSQKASGIIGVTDAYPISLGRDRLFEPDVITPHYPSVKTEFDVEPRPILFLTISPGVVFKFLIFFNKKVYEVEGKRKVGLVYDTELGSKPVSDILNYAVYYGSDLDEILVRDGKIDVNFVPWVDRAILYAFIRGIGAKVSLGYSRFRLISYRVLEVKG